MQLLHAIFHHGKKNFMIKNISLLVFCFSFVLIVKSQGVSGIILDAKTGENLPFATLVITGTTTGSISNKAGEFNMVIPDSLLSKGITISYLGYKNTMIGEPKSGSFYTVKLTPSVTTLSEVIVRPLKPEDYIKRAVKKIPQNYAALPFGTLAYYREKFQENGNFIAFHEAAFESYCPAYLDTIPNQHKLVLYRTTDDIQDIQFMRDKMLKSEAKEKRKALKKGEEYDEDDTKDFISASFGGPEEVLSSDLVKKQEDYLDSTKFKKFRYEFAPESEYMDREMMVINFKSRGTVDHMRLEGKIYIDNVSEAIAVVEYSGEFVIPVALKPIILAFGLTIGEILFNKKVHYQFADNYWYPKTIQMDVTAPLTKIHMFKPNQKSVFDIEQIFTINQLYFDKMIEFDKEQRFDSEKPMDEQIFNNGQISWSDILYLMPERTTATSLR